MRITPLEIRQKTFEKVFRGYDKDEVTAFLTSLSNAWERVIDDNKELKIKLDQAEKEVEKLREVESSLFKTLKTAEDTGANMVEQANKTAELHMKETQMRSEALLNDSKNKARALIEKAESQARMIMDDMEDALKKSYDDYKALALKKQELVKDLKRIAGEVADKADTFEESKGFNLEDFAKKSKATAREYGDFKAENDIEIEMPTPIKVPDVKDLPVPEVKIPKPAPVAVRIAKPAPKAVPEPAISNGHTSVPEVRENSGQALSFFDELED